MEVSVEADGVVPTGTVTLTVGDVQLGPGHLVDGSATATINRNRVGPGVHRWRSPTPVTARSRLPRVGHADRQQGDADGGRDQDHHGVRPVTTMAVRVGATGVVPTGEVVLKVGDVRLGSGTLTDGGTGPIAARKLRPAPTR